MQTNRVAMMKKADAVATTSLNTPLKDCRESTQVNAAADWNKNIKENALAIPSCA